MFPFRRNRTRSIKYLKSDDDHRQHLNATTSSPPNYPHSPKKPIQIEHPHLLSSSSPIDPNHHRPHSSTSITTNDTLSDRESLLKQAHRSNARSTNIDNFYEEIKEQQQQQQANLALGNHPDPNPYLEPSSLEARRKLFEDMNSSQPIRDHREVFYYECEG